LHAVLLSLECKEACKLCARLVLVLVAAEQRAEHAADPAGRAVGDRGRTPRRRRLGGLKSLNRILAHVLARELSAFLDLSLQFRADVALGTPTPAGAVLLLGTSPRLLAAAAVGLLLAVAAVGLLLAVAAVGLLLPVAAMARLLAVPSAWLLLSAALALLVLLRPALRLWFTARWLGLGFGARAGLG